jgi:hypothetical protein
MNSIDRLEPMFFFSTPTRVSDRISLYLFCLGLATLLTLVPSLSIVNAAVGAERLLSFEIMVTHTLVTLGVW